MLGGNAFRGGPRRIWSGFEPFLAPFWDLEAFFSEEGGNQHPDPPRTPKH